MRTAAPPAEPGVTLGLRANTAQFALLVLVNAFVGGMVGLERAVLPLLAERDFGVASKAAVLSFIVSFGLAKALANLAAGAASDRWGRKRVLVAGWVAGVPVPLLVMFAPRWEWVIAANALLGVNQGLCWSTTVIMKVDLVGPVNRGLALGLNEASGYVAVSLAALASGYLAAAHGLRVAPFVPGLVLAVLGLLVSSLAIRETLPHARSETSLPTGGTSGTALPFHRILAMGSGADRTLFAISQAGMVNNLNDGVIWGLFPLYGAAMGLSLREIAALSAIYPAVWGFGQLLTGPVSDRVGRKPLIVAGMSVQAASLAALVLTHSRSAWSAAMALLGVGTALVYPTLLAAVSDVTPSHWRASAIGVYRLWRDSGYLVGALLAGFVADRYGLTTAFWIVAAITFLSGAFSASVMPETHRRVQHGKES